MSDTVGDQFNLFMENYNKNTACDSACQRAEELATLKQNYLNALNNLETAPQQVQTTYQDYLTFAEGSGAYQKYFCSNCKRRFHAPRTSVLARLYYPSCPNCGEKDKIKANGKEKKTAGKIYQNYSCESCGRRYKIIEANPELMDAIRKIGRGLRQD